MKKIHKILATGFLSAATIAGFSSCADGFLDEKYTVGYTTQYLETEEGLNTLAISLYGNIRYHYAYEWAYAYTQYGCDEFSTGTDLTSDPWNVYDARLGAYTEKVNANTPQPENLWDQMYYGISSCNSIIAGEDIFENEATKNLCLGEAYLLRGYNYLRLVSHYGDVVLKTTPATGVERNYTRASVEECSQQMIDDLQKAYEYLPESSPRGTGGWMKATAAHFLAKALLFRCSERNADWNSSYITADLERIIPLCDYVASARPLANDFRDLWYWTGVDCDTEKNPEFLMVAMFNMDGSAQGRYGNRTFSYFNPQFQTISNGWVKRGPFIGLDFQRCRPTEYNYKTYDKVNDSRFWKSFRTVYNANQIGSGDYDIEVGDQAILFICNEPEDNRFDNVQFGRAGDSEFVNPETGKPVPNAFIHYQKGQWQQYEHNVFAGLSKFEDGSRIDEKDDFGHRDGVLARTGETYLIKAEALVRQGKYQEAINVVNELRKRAEFKSGEDRTWHTDGTVAFEKNSLYSSATNVEYYKAYSSVNAYYLTTNVPETTAASSLQIVSYTQLPAEDEAILADLGCSSDHDRMINFILNERTRELNGEFVRWEDLSRTKQLLKRAYLYNNEVARSANLKEHHLLRPIPQGFLDGLQNEDGSGLTAEQRKALQNPGY